MRLSLFGWPPIASHLVCLFLGFALANLMSERREEPLNLPRHGVAVGFDRSVSAASSNPMLRGERVVLVRRGAAGGEARCRVGGAAGRLVQIDPRPVVVFGVSDALEALTQLRAAAVDPGSEIVPIKSAAGLPLQECRSEPKVEYGREG